MTFSLSSSPAISHIFSNTIIKTNTRQTDGEREKNRKKEKEKERSSESSETDVQSILIKIQIGLNYYLSFKIMHTFTTDIAKSKGLQIKLCLSRW